MVFCNDGIRATVTCKSDVTVLTRNSHTDGDSHNVFHCKKSILGHTAKGRVDEAYLFDNKVSKHLKILSVKKKGKRLV